MKSLMKFAFVAGVAVLIAGCGPQGNKNNQNQAQNQNTMQDMSGRHHGGKLRRICASDIQKYCSGETKIRKCLRENSSKLEPVCNTALQQAIERRRERKMREQNNNQTLSQPTTPTNGTQPQNQMAPQSNRHNSSSNDDDDDD